MLGGRSVAGADYFLYFRAVMISTWNPDWVWLCSQLLAGKGLYGTVLVWEGRPSKTWNPPELLVSSWAGIQ